MLHSCRTILVLSCELLARWVSDLVVCIFIVYLCIHALPVSYHLNWLISLFPGWVVDCAVAVLVREILNRLFLSDRFQFKRAEITSSFSLTVVQNRVQSQNTKPQMFFKKVWTTVINFSFETWILLPVRLSKNGYDCTYLAFIMQPSY